jgi:DNA-binding NarL/FixJ family response regulator
MNRIALVDDHVLLRNGLATLVRTFDFEIVFEADNGEECIQKIQSGFTPDVILMDLNMPVKDGYETTLWLKQHYPEIKVLALTMIDDEESVIRVIKNGARGYLLKECSTIEFKKAIQTVQEKGYYYSEMVTGKLVHNVTGAEQNCSNGNHREIHLTDKEVEFLKMACSEMTYKEIALKMKLSPRTVDTYRDHLFEKLELKTRTGLAIYAIKNGIVKV